MKFFCLFYLWLEVLIIGAHTIGRNSGTSGHVSRREISKRARSLNDERGHGLIADIPAPFHSSLYEIDEILRMFVDRLKCFVQDYTFLNFEFEIAADRFERRILEIGGWAEILAPYHGKLAGRYRFAENLFIMMSKATKYLRYFRSNDQGADLIREIINLNISILALHNWKGLPGMEELQYVEDIIHLRRQLEKLRKRFATLEEVPLCVHLMFVSQCEEARKAFQVLQRFVSGTEVFAKDRK